MKLLTSEEIAQALKGLPGWQVSGIALTRTFVFPDFPSVIRFVDQVAVMSEEVGHHPDMDIRYNRLTIGLSTHDAGGVTRRDLDFAQGLRTLLEVKGTSGHEASG